MSDPNHQPLGNVRAIVELVAFMMSALALPAQSVGTVVAWGQQGQARTHLPQGLTNVIAIAAGGYDILGFAIYSEKVSLKADGTLVDWQSVDSSWRTNSTPALTNLVGLAVGGQVIELMADGTLSAFITPPDLSNVVAVSTGWNHALVLNADGTLAAGGIFGDRLRRRRRA